MISYYVLNDISHKGYVVRKDKDCEINDFDGWKPFDMIDYFFGGKEYTMVSEEEAFKQIETKRKEYAHLIKRARNIAKRAHAEQKDKGGNPYIEHIRAVVEGVDAPLEKVVAYLHDTVEDADVTFEELETEFPEEVIAPLKLLTHQKNVPYMDYVKKIKYNEIARKVKLSDLHNNMDISRIPSPTEKDLWRIEKYKKAESLLK